jgi:MFS transporter, AAHS family, 4-hydroxybenzoate transporter
MTSDGEVVDLERLLDSARLGPYPLIVWLLTSLALVFDGFDIQAIAFAAPALLAEWGMTRAALAMVLAAGLIGMGVGALTLGAFGDRYGRRRALIGCMALIAVASLLSAYAAGRIELAAWRFLTGIGLGGALPNATALMVEFAPARVRNLVVAATVAGVPVGGMLGSSVAAIVVPEFGWHSIFLVGAVLPAALSVVMALWLPESPRFLATRPARSGELARLMNRVVGDRRFHDRQSWLLRNDAGVRPGIRTLFTAAYRRDTLLIWLIFFSNVLSVYSYFNWMPTLLTGVGLPIATALRGAFTFNLGGVFGSLLGAFAMTRFGSLRVLATLGLFAALSTFAIGMLPIGPAAAVAPLFILVFVAGFCIPGLQVQMYTVAAHAYPTRIRATGVGSALGIARLGGIVSSFAGSLLLGLGEGLTPFFTSIGMVLLLTLTGVVLLRSHLPPADMA